MMDLEGLDICSICMDSYDVNIRPRNLPCGHTFCTKCITRTIKEERIECPHCKVPHRALNGSDFPISFLAEAMISKIRDAKFRTIHIGNTENALSASGTQEVNRRIQKHVNYMKEIVKTETQTAKTTKNESEKNRKLISEKVAKHRDLITAVTGFLQINEDIIKELEVKELKLTKYSEEHEIYQADISNALSKLENTTESSDKLIVCEELVKLLDALGGWNSRWSVMKYVSDRADSPQALLVPTCDVFKENLVCAVHERDGLVYTANILSKNGKIYLHRLEENEPSDDVLVFQYHKLIQSLDKDNMVAFMDLAFDGRTKGRIHISLSPQTPLATQFWKLCTGEKGPCYVHTRFLRVLYKGRYDERVVAGDYEKGDGSGGAPLFTGRENKRAVYSRSSEVGSIGAVENQNGGPRSTQFVICTRKHTHSRNIIFGHVQDRLDLVKAAIELDDIKKVQIVDCGIVLNF